MSPLRLILGLLFLCPILAKSHDLTQLVEDSRHLVFIHDKIGWLATYHPEASIEDPVGTFAHRGEQELSRFYDTFIEPNEVTFVDQKILTTPMSQWRQSTVVVRAADYELRVPAYILYEAQRNANGNLRLAKMQAYWNMSDTARTMRQTCQGFKTMMNRGCTMLSHLGMQKTIQFFWRGQFKHISKKQSEKELLKLTHAILLGKIAPYDDLPLVIHSPAGAQAGDILYMDDLELSEMQISGYQIVGSFSMTYKNKPLQGIARIQFSTKKQISKIEFWTES
jgi:hypothetical protein